jgi:hypothetical protein
MYLDLVLHVVITGWYIGKYIRTYNIHRQVGIADTWKKKKSSEKILYSLGMGEH